MAETARAMMVEKRILIDFGFLGVLLGIYIIYLEWFWEY